MERIYFDKQIFSYLFKGKDDLYQSFLKNLYDYKNNFLFCYSHGHLLDLKNDKTNIKYDELNFMQTLVDDNYLCYYANDKGASCYLATPSDAFKEIDTEDETISFTNLFEGIDLTFATEEQKEQIAFAKNLFTNQKLDFGFSSMGNIPEDMAGVLKKVLPISAPELTISEWTEHFTRMIKTMEEDKTVYKGLRKIVDEHVNHGKFKPGINFNEDLKKSALNKTFIDYVTTNLNPKGDKEITNYDFFTNAYFTLDLLGISKEASKSVKFRNVINDAIHSYYGAYCNYVVSDDNGFIKKTQIMYTLLGIKTHVYHIDDFIKSFYFLKENNEIDVQSFFNLIVNDVKHGLVINSKKSIKYNRDTTTIKPIHTYLNYFNILDYIIENNDNCIVLTRQTQNYSDFVFFREYEGVVNRAINLFGIDSNMKGDFNWNVEIAEIKHDSWKGRHWQLNDTEIFLEINEGSRKLSLVLRVN